jgi:hypothetical protein
MSSNKPRVIKDFEKLDPDIQEQIKLKYPDGFYSHLVYYTNRDGQSVTALPFETEEKYYLVRMTVIQAKAIIEDDDDYDLEGNLKDEVRERYEDKYSESDMDYLPDQIPDGDMEPDDE